MLGWVVGWGTSWGGGKGVKLTKNQVMIKIGDRNDKNKNNDFVIRITSNLMISTKKPELSRILGEKTGKEALLTLTAT